MIPNSYPSYLHVLAWLQTVCTLYNVGPFLLLACCHTAHAGLSEFRPDVMILVKRQGFIDFVNASASIRPFSIHHNASPQGEYSRLLFWPFPVHKDCLNAASSIPSLLSWTFLGTSAFDQAHAVRHPNVFHLHLALLVPVCHRHQFACHFAQDTSQTIPCSTAL